MSRRHHEAPGQDTPKRVLGIGSAIGLMVAVLLAVGPWLRAHGDLQVQVAEAPPPIIEAPGRPIEAEAGVFRIRPSHLAAAPNASRRSDAHPRTMNRYRSQRAYPGAPPPIPHGLTIQEMRDQNCKTCHERGGYVPRFTAYAPVTPHPQMLSCLQCHAPNDRVVGVRLSESGGRHCLQCHVLDRGEELFVPSDWATPNWPATEQRALPGGPPAIPHSLQFRESCVACHSGPAAVAEIRTMHAGRGNCRQCHVLSAAASGAESDVFSRPLDLGAGPDGGTP